MRYFKCDLPLDNSQLKAQYSALLAEDQKLQRKRKLLSRLGTVVFVLVLVLVLVVAGVLGNLIIPEDDGSVLMTVVNVVCRILWGLCFAILAPLAATFAAAPLWFKYPDCSEQARALLRSKGCEQLREYYGFHKPFLVTKCFDSSDRRFRRHDVCLFFVDGELRLTVNLHYGFFDSERDLGCYAFRREELQLQSVPHAGHPAAELKCGDTVFLLGIRAEKFIRDHFDPPRQEQSA